MIFITRIALRCFRRLGLTHTEIYIPHTQCPEHIQDARTVHPLTTRTHQLCPLSLNTQMRNSERSWYSPLCGPMATRSATLSSTYGWIDRSSDQMARWPDRMLA